MRRRPKRGPRWVCSTCWVTYTEIRFHGKPASTMPPAPGHQERKCSSKNTTDVHAAKPGERETCFIRRQEIHPLPPLPSCLAGHPRGDFFLKTTSGAGGLYHQVGLEKCRVKNITQGSFPRTWSRDMFPHSLRGTTGPEIPSSGPDAEKHLVGAEGPFLGSCGSGLHSLGLCRISFSQNVSWPHTEGQ